MTSVWFVVSLCVICDVAQFHQFQLFEGDLCVLHTSGQTGKCTAIRLCPYAIDLIKSSRGTRRPQTCGFDKSTPIVCCPEESIAQPGNENVAPPRNENVAPPRNENVAPSVVQVPEKLTAKPGNKSLEKCYEFYPEVPTNSYFYFGGTKSLVMEFPHMAVIGYGSKEDIQWLCGGSLISTNFVLTAAHCLYSQESGDAKWVRLGDLDLSITTDDAEPQDFDIAQAIPHPDYNPPSHYHDIALFRLDRPVRRTAYVRPACLYWNRTSPRGPFLGTGWGRTSFLGEASSHLLKVELDHVGHEECRRRYSTSRKLENGILDEIQICAGDDSGKDACAGDSGGPLQVTFARDYIFQIVGVTSFGKACGIGSTAGVYTRVAPYVPWIEDLVWPN